MELTPLDQKRLTDVHPDLVKVVEAAAPECGQPFQVFEGRRTLERQREYVRRGVSKTLRSRHLTGHAVDLVPLIDGKLMWSRSACLDIAEVMKKAAVVLDVALRWGGDWDRDGKWRDERFFDGPHFELERKIYPDSTDPRVNGPHPIDDLITEAAEQEANKTLVFGDRGERVERLQRQLFALGHAVEVDGAFGPVTHAAVKHFQRATGQAVDGVVGRKTRWALKRFSEHLEQGEQS